MTPDTEDLLWRRFNEWFRSRRPDYPSEWDAYQAGHADAKAENAAPVVGRWYFVANDGAATLCVDEADARESAAEADIAFPRMAPHRAVQLVPADQLAAAVAKERERPSITLTTLEIADLAKFAGLLCGLPNRESREDQVTIEPCPEDGLRDDDEGEIWSSSWIAYMTEYPEEGSVTLGNTIRAGAKEPSDADKT